MHSRVSQYDDMKHLYRVILCIALTWSWAFAWDDCPFGQVNDRCPGTCGLYEDSNRDSICDRSQRQFVQVAAIADSSRLNNSVPPTAPLKQRKTKPAPPAKQDAPITAIAAAVAQQQDAPMARPPSPLRQRYPLWQIFLITAILAVATELLAAYNRKLTLPLQTAWNWALLLSFLLTVAFSVPFVYPALLKAIDFNVAYWHSLTGLVMIAAGLYHLVRRFGSIWRGARSWFG